jgi:hypothetical protein
MSLVEINPYECVPDKVQEWFIHDIEIVVDKEGTKFNLADLFKHDNKDVAKSDQGLAAIKFCPLLYPPPIPGGCSIANKKAVKKAQDAIALPCWKHAGITFNKSRSCKTTEDVVYYMQCSLGVAYRERKDKRQENADEGEDQPTQQASMYKENVKGTRIVNQDTTSRGPDGKKAPRRTQTLKGSKECLCKFQIQLRLKIGKYWYLRFHLKSMGWHNHEYIPSHKKHRKLANLSVEQRQREAILSQYTHSGSVQAITQAMDGDLPLTRGQLHYNSQTSSGNRKNPNSGAEDLIQFLKQEVALKKKRYIALFHEVTNTSLLAISKYELRRIAKDAASAESDLPENLDLLVEHGSESGTVNTTVQRAGALDKAGLQEALHSIQKNLQIGQKILIAIAWSREDERRLFEKFPEVFMIDVTMGMNNQGLPEMVLCSPGPDMRTFTPVRAFLPSQCKWVFNWLFGTAFPALLGQSSLARTQLVLSDGDPKIYLAFAENQPRTYSNAMHGLCTFHLITKPIVNAGSLFRRRDDATVKDQIHTFKHWVYTWVQLGGVESEDEYELSYRLLKEWLAEFRNDTGHNGRSNNIVDALRHNSEQLEIMLLKITNYKSKWFIPLRKHKLHLQQKTTSPLENVFSIAKTKASKKVTPSMSLRTSVETQDIQVQNRMNELERRIQIDSASTPLWTNSTSKSELTNFAEGLKHVVMSQRDRYHSRVGIVDNQIQVIRKSSENIFCHDCHNCKAFCVSCYRISPIPRWRRIRTITIQRTNQSFFSIECDCLHNDGYPCRHIASLTDLLAGHFIPRYHKGYISRFGQKDHKEATEFYQRKLLDRRFFIDEEEQKRIFQSVAANQSSDSEIWPEELTSCYQVNRNGMLSHELRKYQYIDGNIESGITENQDGGMSQELALPATTPIAEHPNTQGLPLVTGDFYHDHHSLLQDLANKAERNGIYKEKLNEMYSQFYEAAYALHRTLESRQQQECVGEYVNLFTPFDKRKRDQRKKAAGEPPRNKKK